MIILILWHCITPFLTHFLEQDKSGHQKWHHSYPKELGYPAFYFLTNTASPVEVSMSSFDDFSNNDNKSFNCPSIELTSL